MQCAPKIQVLRANCELSNNSSITAGSDFDLKTKTNYEIL